MRKRIYNKLSSRSGETLAEVLVALLIIALSSMLLVVMMGTASGIDRQTRQREETFYKDLSNAETHTAEDGTPATGEIRIKTPDDETQTIQVTVYGGSGLTSYEKKAGDAP